MELAIERNGTIEETIHVVTVGGSFENCYITRNTFFYLLEQSIYVLYILRRGQNFSTGN